MRSFASGELRAKISSRCVAEQPVERGLAHLVELVAVHGHLGGDADPPGDLRRSESVIAGHDHDAQARGMTLGDGVGHLGSGRIEHGNHADQAEGALGRLPLRSGASSGARVERRPALAGPAPRSPRTPCCRGSCQVRVLAHTRRPRASAQRPRISSGAPLAWTTSSGPSASMVDISFSAGSK